jgi:hypothetical protein
MDFEKKDIKSDSENEPLTYIINKKINDKAITRKKKTGAQKKDKTDDIDIKPVLEEPIKEDKKITILEDKKEDIKEDNPIISTIPIPDIKPDDIKTVEIFLTKNSSDVINHIPEVEEKPKKAKRELTEKQKEHLKKIQRKSKEARDKKKKETIEDATINKLKDVIKSEIVPVVETIKNKYNEEISLTKNSSNVINHIPEKKEAPKNDTMEKPEPVMVKEPPAPIVRLSRYEQNMQVVYQKFKKVEPVKKTSFIELMRQSYK